MKMHPDPRQPGRNPGLSYHAPFTQRNREQDYAMVWAVLDDRSSEV
jgi:hypothetical protein